jgi:hypothetical protein
MFAELGFSETLLPNILLPPGDARRAVLRRFAARWRQRNGWARSRIMLLSRLLANLKRRRRFDRSFQPGHPLNETSHLGSMLLKHLARNVEVFLAVPHLIP